MNLVRPTIAVVLLCTACEPAPEPVGAEPGEPLPGLTEEEQGRFRSGRSVFERVAVPEEGLGPLYNADRCTGCHQLPAAGGVGYRVPVVKATRYEAGTCNLLESEGGDIFQQRVTVALGVHGITTERVPESANGRTSSPAPALFGSGLVEAIPETAILGLEDPDDADGNGVSGRAGRSPDGRVGRFGRKAELPTVAEFIDTELRFELGLTTPANPREEMPNGIPLPEDSDPTPEPEIDDRNAGLLTDYVRFLAPPSPEIASGAVRDSIEGGRRTFEELGCAVCHTPSMETGEHPVAALSRKRVQLYSDLLLHDMGAELAGVCGPAAAPSEYVTTKLWGLRYRRLYLHDGRAVSLDDAIDAHGGEATASRDAWQNLAPARRVLLNRFLRSL